MKYECCARQSLAIMDHKWPLFCEEPKIMINTMCMKCETHWAGIEGSVKKYSKRQWEEFINTIYSEIK